jgi:AcrR family transcriptional regulator
MPKPTPHTLNAKLAAAALQIAVRRGWGHVTLDAVSKETIISLVTLKKRFSEPQELIPIIVGEIMRESIGAAGKPAGSPHDILFDLLMARFDILQKNRKAVLSIADAARHDHALACTLVRAVFESMVATVDAAKLDTSLRPVRAVGLSTVYAWAFLAWIKDNTHDMSKTMAALDKGLRLDEKTMELFKRCF